MQTNDIYNKGRSDGEQAVLRMIELVLKNRDTTSPARYYVTSLLFILELYGYGTEKETKKECTQQET